MKGGILRHRNRHRYQRETGYRPYSFIHFGNYGNLIGLSHTYQVTGRVLLGRRCSLRETRSIGAARYAMNHSSR